MAAEITGGWIHPMALLADGTERTPGARPVRAGLHGGPALCPRHAVRLWNVEDRGAGRYSARFLVLFAALMLFNPSNAARAGADPRPGHLSPSPVNLACAWLLKDGQGHSHSHGEIHHHHDLNLVFRLPACGRGCGQCRCWPFSRCWAVSLGACWLDPVMGIVGAGLVSVWAYGLLRDTGRVLPTPKWTPVTQEIRTIAAARCRPASAIYVAWKGQIRVYSAWSPGAVFSDYFNGGWPFTKNWCT